MLLKALKKLVGFYLLRGLQAFIHGHSHKKAANLLICTLKIIIVALTLLSCTH